MDTKHSDAGSKKRMKQFKYIHADFLFVLLFNFFCDKQKNSCGLKKFFFYDEKKKFFFVTDIGFFVTEKIFFCYRTKVLM